MRTQVNYTYIPKILNINIFNKYLIKAPNYSYKKRYETIYCLQFSLKVMDEKMLNFGGFFFQKFKI